MNARLDMQAMRHLALAAIVILASTGRVPGQMQPSPGGGGGAQRLIPAGYGVRTDKKGNSWNFQQSGVLGRVGDSMLNTGLNLKINNQSFYNYQPMMSADGAEYVLQHGHPQQMMGLQVTRRIRLHESEGVVRYLEVLANPSGYDVSADVELHSSFNGNFRNYVSNQGSENFTTMGPKESSLIVNPGSATHAQAYLFTVSSPKGGLKPTLANPNKYSMVVHFQVTIPAGQTVCLMHSVTQVSAAEASESKALAKLFKDNSLSRLVARVPSELRGSLANYSSEGGFGGMALMSSTSVEALGVERARQDVLALGERTRLLGKAGCDRLVVTTTYGQVTVPFENVAALVGGNRGRSDVARVFLRDGQVFSGRVETEDLRFVLPSGAKMDLDVRSLDRLVRSKAPDEGQWGGGVIALMETFRGDRIALRGDGGNFLACVTPWGSMDFSLDEVLWISPPEEEAVGHLVEFKNGSRFFAYLGGESPVLKSELLGDFRIRPQEVRSLVTNSISTMRTEREDDSKEEEPQEPHLLLAGGQRLVGQISAPELHVISNAEPLVMAPEAIRLMRKVSGEVEDGFENSPPFQIELWGGGVVLGYLRETVVPVRVRGEEWRIPLQDIAAVVSPQPRVSDAARTAIGKLIRALGDDDWRVRENASEELGEYGFLAKSLLVDALRVTDDAEVKRRLEELIDSVE